MDFNKIVTQVHVSSNNESDLKNLKQFLQKNEDFMIKNVNLIDDALNALGDVNRYTLAWLYILGAKAVSNNRGDNQRFIAQVQQLIANCSPDQARLATRKLTGICRKFTEALIDVRQPMRGVLPLRTVLTLLVTANPAHLTPVHADFVVLCLLSKTYRTAVPLLEEDIFEVNTDETGVTPKDLLSFYYYGGLIYLGLKQYGKAIDFFRTSFTSPAITLSAIALEAYKKYLLTSLIKFGALPPLPKYTPAVVHRTAKSACPQYHEFVAAYGTHNPDEVHRVAAQHADLFTKDGNFGLVKQCIKALNSNNVRRLTQTYLTLSLNDIKDNVKLPTVADTERSILRMIEEGDIYAQINQRDGMVAFQDSPERYSSNSSMQSLDANIHNVISIEKRIKATDEAISLTPQYVHKLLGHERRGGQQWGDLGGVLDEQTMLELGGLPASALQKFM